MPDWPSTLVRIDKQKNYNNKRFDNVELASEFLVRKYGGSLEPTVASGMGEWRRKALVLLVNKIATKPQVIPWTTTGVQQLVV